ADPQDAGGLGVGDALAVGMQFDVVADATAERAGRVLHNGQLHVPVPLSSVDLAVRTGRDDEGSAQRPAPAAAPDAPRHVPPGFDLFPGLDLFRVGLIDKMRLPVEFHALTARLCVFHRFSPARQLPLATAPTGRDQDAGVDATGSTSTS